MTIKFQNFIEYYNIKKYNLYLYYLSSRISRCKSVYELFSLFKNINFFYPYMSSDNLLTILTECIKRYPLSIEEIQYFSTLQQEYDNQNGVEGYITIVMWMAIIQSINEQPRIQY